MYRIIWTLQILGLAQFVRVFNNENAFVSTWENLTDESARLYSELSVMDDILKVVRNQMRK